jgi:hypothetical protein
MKWTEIDLDSGFTFLFCISPIIITWFFIMGKHVGISIHKLYPERPFYIAILSYIQSIITVAASLYIPFGLLEGNTFL